MVLTLSAPAHRKDTKMHQVPCYAPERGFTSLNSDSICFQICVAGTDCVTIRWAAFHRVKFEDKLQLLLTATAENCKYFSLSLWKRTTSLFSILISLLCFCSLFRSFIFVHYPQMPLFLLGSMLYAQRHAFVFFYALTMALSRLTADNMLLVEGSLILSPHRLTHLLFFTACGSITLITSISLHVCVPSVGLLFSVLLPVL